MSTTAATAPAAASQPESPAGLSHRQIMVILSGLMLGMFLAALDQSIVATAIRTIADDLKGLDEQAWATTAYLITSTISTPIYGKLSDMFGRKPFFLTAISIFIIGSIACTFSTSMYMLAAFRALQGLGAGGLMSLALTIIADIVPARQRAKYQGYFLAVFATSSVAGPVIGGLFAGTSSILGIDGWRWVFLVNVPIAAVALVVVAKVLNIPHRRGGEHRIDWLGATTLIVGLVPLLLVAEQGRVWGWGSTYAAICYVVGAVGLVSFIFIERRLKDHALIPLKLFRSGTFSVASIGGLLVGLAMFGGIAILPQFMQIVRGASPTESGLLMLPFVVGMMLFSVVSGQITSRTGHYKVFPIIGMALVTAAAVMFYLRLTPEISFVELSGYMLGFGAGIGMCMQTLTLAAQNAVPVQDTGVATSTSTMTRQLGATLGTAVFLSLLFSTVGSKIGDAFRSAATDPNFRAALANPTGGAESQQVARQLASGPQGAAALGARVVQDSSFLQRIDPRLAHPFLSGFTQSMILVFLSAAVVAAVAFVVFWFMKEVPLRSMSGVQARAAAAAENGAGVPAEVPAEARMAAPEPVAVIGSTTGAGDLAGPPTDRWAEHELVYASSGGNGNGGNGNGNGNGGNGNGHHAATVLSSTGQFAPGGGGAHRAPAGSGFTVSSGSAGPSGSAGLPGGSGGSPGGGIPVSGRVYRGMGDPVAGAVLTLIDTAGRQVSKTTVGANGEYRLQAPGAGHYVLIASATAHQPEASTVVVGDTPVEADIALIGTAGLGGTVTSASSGGPISGATTTLADGRGEVVGARHTDDRGGYAFNELVAGDYTLVVSADAYRPLALSVNVADAGQTTQDVALTGGAKLAGVARAGADHHPVGDARITLLDAEGHVIAVTDTGPDGAYSFGDLAEGDYTVIASGYPPVASNLRIDGDQPGDHDVTLTHPDDQR